MPADPRHETAVPTHAAREVAGAADAVHEVAVPTDTAREVAGAAGGVREVAVAADRVRGATAPEGEQPAPEPDGPPTAPEPTGATPTVAAAVAHALAARAAAGRGVSTPAPVPSRTADARDRLLAVLLADPARAVGAAEELATCRGQLSDVLARLAQSGLSTAQLARLSGFTVEQVTTLLAQHGANR